DWASLPRLPPPCPPLRSGRSFCARYRRHQVTRSLQAGAVDAVEHLPDRLEVAVGGFVDEPARDQLQLIGRAAVRLPGLALQLAQDGPLPQPEGFADFALLVGRGHHVCAGFEPLLPGSEISRPRLHAVRVVVVESEAAVAFVAEQAADPAGAVAMIDAQEALGLFLADRADATLQRQQQIVLLERDPMPHEYRLAVRFALLGKQPGTVIRIGCPSLPQ